MRSGFPSLSTSFSSSFWERDEPEKGEDTTRSALSTSVSAIGGLRALVEGAMDRVVSPAAPPSVGLSSLVKVSVSLLAARRRSERAACRGEAPRRCAAWFVQPKPQRRKWSSGEFGNLGCHVPRLGRRPNTSPPLNNAQVPTGEVVANDVRRASQGVGQAHLRRLEAQRSVHVLDGELVVPA